MTQEEFDIKLKEHLAKLLTPKKATIRRPGPVQKTAEVKCKVCGKSLGYMSQVRKFGQSHFLIMDGTLHEKVKPYPDPTVMKPMDGMLFQKNFSLFFLVLMRTISSRPKKTHTL